MNKHIPLVALSVAISVCNVPPAVGDDDPERAELVRPGTALARLIEEAENHPMHRLALVANTQGGQKIKSDVPSWLRAHYMRNHPETRTAARSNDPTGGFPLALDSLYVWMLLHQDLQPSAAKEALAARQVAVGKNLRISGANTSPMSESDIRINFKDSNRIIAASNNIGPTFRMSFDEFRGVFGAGQGWVNGRTIRARGRVTRRSAVVSASVP